MNQQLLQEQPPSVPLTPLQAYELLDRLQARIATVLLGKPEPIRLTTVALLAGGHVLVEDVPGVGKTSLAKAFARCLDCEFKRLQFTPDMLPSDILGASVFLPSLGEFEFRQGPVFTNILLADEINRTTPRTQSALLEAMEEKQVSVEGVTYELSQPFFVMATQNPFEFEGTYPLPENQLDRFMLSINIGYPAREFEKQALVDHRAGEPLEKLQPVLNAQQLQGLRQLVREVKVNDSISNYLLDVVEKTRAHEELSLGVSTRGALTLYRAMQSYALLHRRDYVIPDDLKALAVPVLAHRIAYKGIIREGQRHRARNVVQQILNTTPVPV